MTNSQKSLLRWIIRHEGGRTDKDIADDVECNVATVRKYRRALTPLAKEREEGLQPSARAGRSAA